jgi:heme exporter protein CcmD
MDLAMGGYGAYVWSSVALTVAVFVGNAWSAHAALAAARERARRARGTEGGR